MNISATNVFEFGTQWHHDDISIGTKTVKHVSM